VQNDQCAEEPAGPGAAAGSKSSSKFSPT